jgi:CheY-like chemotaxis protein
MAQVLMNLLVNARDAMPDGGVVMLGTGIVTLDQTYARAHPGTREGAYVTLAVKDRGVGMDSHTLAHCFEPFFTTKARGQGTGLGLATVYGIIKQSDGSIEIDSEPGRGTTVQVYLPKLDNVESVEAAAASSTGTALGGSETILLVEDDAKVRKLIRHTIERLGYQVFEAPSGAAALALAQAHDAIDLLLTDVVMPEMSGAELANQLGAWRPELKILFMSGYTEYARKLPDDVTTGARLLLKPFTPDELARKVRDVLDTPSQESVIAER